MRYNFCYTSLPLNDLRENVLVILQEVILLAKQSKSLGSGLAIGLRIGVALGLALNNISVAIAIGFAIGIAFNSSLFANDRTKHS